VRNGNEKCFHGLAAQITSRLIDNRARDHQRHTASGFYECISNSKHRGLSVERVKNGFDDKKVDTTFEQRLGLIEVSLAQLIERDRAKCRIVYVR